LMAGHTMRRRPSFIIDVEGYRERREQALARLAERMADKALRRGQPLTLEPMPPNERRIIHITLRDNDQVYTESVGIGRERKVRIYLH
jgi:spoIIIJ-associated protein